MQFMPHNPSSKYFLLLVEIIFSGRLIKILSPHTFDFSVSLKHLAKQWFIYYTHCQFEVQVVVVVVIVVVFHVLFAFFEGLLIAYQMLAASSLISLDIQKSLIYTTDILSSSSLINFHVSLLQIFIRSHLNQNSSYLTVFGFSTFVKQLAQTESKRCIHTK